MRYVVVPDDPADKAITGGPYEWDGQSDWEPPEPGRLMTEAEALAAGYTPRPLPPEVVNADLLRGKAALALQANAAYLAIANPTNAQVVTQVQRLTRECSALIRLLLGALDTTDGT